VGVVSADLANWPIASERMQAVMDAARALEAQGHAIVEIPVEKLEPLIKASACAFDRIISVNLAYAVDAFAIDENKLEPLTRTVAQRGRNYAATTLYAAMNDEIGRATCRV